MFFLLFHYRRQGGGCLFVFLLMVATYASFFAWRANLDMSNDLMRGVVGALTKLKPQKEMVNILIDIDAI